MLSRHHTLTPTDEPTYPNHQTRAPRPFLIDANVWYRTRRIYHYLAGYDRDISVYPHYIYFLSALCVDANATTPLRPGALVFFNRCSDMEEHAHMALLEKQEKDHPTVGLPAEPSARAPSASHAYLRLEL